MSDKKPENIITRRDVRERAMQVLYAWEISKEPIEMLVESIAGADLASEPEHFTFAQSLVYASINHRSEADELIRARAQNWSMERIAVLDLVILRLGIAEFLYFPDIPAKVTINECVELAKKFSTANSGRFINGLLDSVLHDLTTSGRLGKTGRGLVDR